MRPHLCDNKYPLPPLLSDAIHLMLEKGEREREKGGGESAPLTPSFPLAKAELVVFVTPIPCMLYMCVCVYIIYIEETHTQIYISKIHYLLFPPTPLQEVDIIINIVQLKTWKNKTQKEKRGG